MHDDLPLLLRAAFEDKASAADTSPEAVARVLPARRRTTSDRRAWWPVAAAASLVLVVGVVALVTRDQRAGSGPAPQRVEPATSLTSTWRTEVWQGVSVQVPRDWGWGGAPMPDLVGAGEPPTSQLISCGTGAFRTSQGRFRLNGDETVPYVGRPVMQTDLCLVYDPADPPLPTADYVWLGVEVPPGTVRLGDYVQETVAVAGSTVTVATRDPALRKAILATARSQQSPCPATVGGGDPSADPAWGALVVCAYTGGDLVYANGVDQQAADDFVRAWQAAPGTDTVDCSEPRSDETVRLATGTQQFEVRFGPGCPSISSGATERLLVEADTVPWAADGLPAYVVGPDGGKGATGGLLRGTLP